MKFVKKYIILLILICISFDLISQTKADLPDAPKFISASVIPESNPLTIQLNWLPSDSLDVVSYIIYNFRNDSWPDIGMASGRLTTNYQYYVNGAYKPEKFRLASYVSPSEKSSMTNAHVTMLLNYEYEKCNVKVTIKWTEYFGWDNGIKNYKVYRRSSNSNYEEIAVVNSNELSYVDNNIDIFKQYYYYVEAQSYEGYKANSNSIEVYTDSYKIPNYLKAEYATVENDAIKIKFVVDNTAEVSSYIIQRRDSINNEFYTLSTITNVGQYEIYHTDKDVNVYNNIYNYRILSINLCGNISKYSNIATNILLRVFNNDNHSQTLKWTAYQVWPNGVMDYRIYNTFDYNNYFVGTNDTASLEYEHNISNYIYNCHKNKVMISNKLCYYVEARAKYSDSDLFTNVSRSNIACVSKYPEIFIPTAFNVTSYEESNREFRPVLSFFENESYEFSVYDRWGLKIFTTNKVYEGWDGRFNDNFAPSQIYQYHVRYKDYNGKLYEKVGIFFLLIQ